MGTSADKGKGQDGSAGRERALVVGVGEVLWDEFADGRRLGGAPANVIGHARALGADGRLISRVGNDPDGRELLERLRAVGMPTATIGVDPNLPTGRVTVRVGEDGQASYEILEPAAWDRIPGDGEGRDVASRADAVCFGTLGQRAVESRRAIRELAAAAPDGAMRVLDVNLRQRYYDRELLAESLALATAVKLNEEELGELSRMFGYPRPERAALERMMGAWELQWAACTRGARGALICDGRSWSEWAAPSVRVVDTVGAGDCYTAALILGLRAGWALDAVNARAGALAAHVCTQAGATPALPSELCAPYWEACGGNERAGREPKPTG